MANRNNDPIEGSRKRSLSESDTERISATPSTPGINVSNRQFLITDLELDHHASNPDISSPGTGLIDTPLGFGRGTRLRSGRKLPSADDQDKLINECSKIKKDIEAWLLTIKSSPPPTVDNIYESYERYKRRVGRINQEALVRRLDMSITFVLAELLIKLEEVKKATSRRERKELNPTGSVVVDYEPDNVFLDLPLPTVNPPAEFPLFNLDKTPSLNHDHSVSSNVSLTDTVNNIIEFVHDANISINPPPLHQILIFPPPGWRV